MPGKGLHSGERPGSCAPRKTRARFLEFCRYLRSLYPPHVRIAIICDNFSPHLTTAKDARIGTWAGGEQHRDRLHAGELVLVNRMEAQFTALRYFPLDGTDHASHKEQASMIRRYIISLAQQHAGETDDLAAEADVIAGHGAHSRPRPAAGGPA